jgi:hypothetical protein
MSDPTQSIFGSQNDQQVTPANQNQGQGSNPPASQNADAVANLLGSIKNEKGEPKYKSLEDALVALQHSQSYIPQLTAKLSEREQELLNARKEADKIAELERTVLALTSPDKAQPAGSPVPPMSEEDIAAIVSKTLNTNQEAVLRQQNLSTVVTSMQSVFGAKAEEVFNSKAKELGMSVQEFNALAARTPKAVMDLIGIKQATNQGSSYVQSSINTGGLAPNQQSFISKNTVPTLIGATSQDLMREAKAARDMVSELHAQGRSVHDLTDPKVYMATFNK